MGFCSGTDIFDPVAEWVLKSDLTPEQQIELIKVLIDALEDHDWDCHDDSRFMKNRIVHRAMKQLHPDWFDDNERS